jgi:hypothetical protein
LNIKSPIFSHFCDLLFFLPMRRGFLLHPTYITSQTKATNFEKTGGLSTRAQMPFHTPRPLSSCHPQAREIRQPPKSALRINVPSATAQL